MRRTLRVTALLAFGMTAGGVAGVWLAGPPWRSGVAGDLLLTFLGVVAAGAALGLVVDVAGRLGRRPVRWRREPPAARR